MQPSQHELTQLAFDVLPQAILIVDGDGCVCARNAAAMAMLPGGESIEEILGAAVNDSIVWREELAAAGAERETALRGVTLAHSWDRRLLVDVTLRRLGPVGDDRLDAVLVVVEDVSGRVSMERRLAASERLAASSRLAARVAHELNNPLDGVLRYIGLAERVAGQEASRYLQGARQGLTRMTRIVRDLLEKSPGGLAEGERTRVEKLLDEAINVMQPRAQALGVAVMCDLAEDASVTVRGSVFQVFCNVIKNALDAMPEGGVLSVRMRRAEDECVLEFCDTGAGLGEADPKRIFEPFYTTKPDGQGSGLGLAMCREIVSRAGGTIAADTPAAGGTRITIRLPVGAERKIDNPGA